MERNNKENKKRVVNGRSLIDLVLSWSFQDVLNKDMYKNQVKQIPSTFSSTHEYFNSFVTPLIAETHADLKSSTETLSLSLCCEIKFLRPSKDYKPPNDLFYNLVLPSPYRNDAKKASQYEPQNGDLFAITRFQPKCVDDLARPYLVAVVLRVNDSLTHSVLSSAPIPFDEAEILNKNKKEKLFAVYLINMTTNIRIWQALNSNPKDINIRIIEKFLKQSELLEDNCMMCETERVIYDEQRSEERAKVWASDLNESQRNAVLSCIRRKECCHENTVKLIWGPPGTGKTRTVGFLLHSLLRMKCRTLTCAPTNVAVLQVAKRLVKSVTGSASFGTYGLGDVVLLGNEKRMNIDDHDELRNVFLSHRIEILYRCLAWWKNSLISMINLLEDAEEQFRLYLKELETKHSFLAENTGSLEERDKNRNQEDESSKEREIVMTKDKKHVEPLTFEEFFMKEFTSVMERLYFCVVNLYTHLPTSLISLEMAEKMVEAVDTLKSFRALLQDALDLGFQGALKYIFVKGENISRGGFFSGLEIARTKSILLLKYLPSAFLDPPSSGNHTDTKGMKQFILENAVLIFCTVSSSAKFSGTSPFELLIIDEAAQLKECESTIPLQLPGIRHAFLIGDERQLPAMVQSKVCENANFGRSLFERLISMGHKRHLLNVQHRMHPSISLFPNKEFYENQILDGQNVKQISYCKRFLQGKMFGSYSFINVTHGREAVDRQRSSKNLVEVAVVSEIVASLYKEQGHGSDKRVRVGVISPYKAQVHAISDAIGEKYSSDAKSDFSVSIRSVDGFQGGEEDVIIISTVRSNGTGYVGFLSNFQRANVALTRARHCLWIVGNGATLSRSSTVWKRLVIDAKERECFHNADEDKNLAQAIAIALIELNQISALPNLVSFLFKEAKWKVLFNDAFWKSMARVKDDKLRKQVLSLLEKLACGWRQPGRFIPFFGNNRASSHIVEYYKIKQMCLVWAVDITKENSNHVQVLRVWDVLAMSDVKKLSKQLDVLYGGYTLDNMSRCKYRCEQRNVVVPMRWPDEARLEGDDFIHFLSKPMASLTLKDEMETASSSANNRIRRYGRSEIIEIARRLLEAEAPPGGHLRGVDLDGIQDDDLVVELLHLGDEDGGGGGWRVDHEEEEEEEEEAEEAEPAWWTWR